MKVYLYGNILNNSYNLVRFLRAKGVDAEMFLDDSSPHGQDYPWWEDPEITKENLPAWIHYYPISPNWLFPQKELKKMIRHFSSCDVALVCGYGPLLSERAKVPFFFFSYGADLNITKWSEYFIAALRNIFHGKMPSALRALLFTSYMQRKALKKAEKIGIGMGYQIENYLTPLGLKDKMVKIRLAWDINKYHTEPDLEFERDFSEYEIVYFMAARHSWKSVWNDLKGNDKFIRAFARYVKDIKPNVILIMIEKGIDIMESKALVKELGIEEYVKWVPEMTKDGIRKYNGLTNAVIVDQFWHNEWYIKYPKDKDRPRIGFGSAAVEALAAGRPLITTFFEEEFYEGQHPPVLSAFTIDEIYNRLVESWKMGREGRRALGDQAYQFVLKYHNWETTLEMYIKVLEEVVGKHKLSNTIS